MGGCPARPPGYPAGHVISMGAAVSAISGALACTVGASRMLCALARDGAGPSPLAAVSARHAVPGRAVAAVVVAGWVFLAVTALTAAGVFARTAAMQAVGQRLTQSEGLTARPSAVPSAGKAA